MYSEEFLKSLGLEEWIKQQQSQHSPQEPANQGITETPSSCLEPPAQMKLVASIPEQNSPPRDCLNCCHFSDGWCDFKNTHIEDRNIETSCEDFQRRQCKDCPEYENGLCQFNGLGKAKNPDDGCEYDFRELL